MGFTAIVSGIFAVAKAVPQVMKLIDMIVSKYADIQIAKINTQRITIKDERAALLKALLRTQTNAEIISLSITLDRINKL